MHFAATFGFERPHTHTDQPSRGERIADAFELLQPDTPVINLSYRPAYNATGIIMAAPTQVELHHRTPSRVLTYHQPFMSPWVSAHLDIRASDKGGRPADSTVEIEVDSLANRNTLIGREAIQAAVSAAKFVETKLAVNDCRPDVQTNGGEIHSLWSRVNSLKKTRRYV